MRLRRSLQPSTRRHATPLQHSSNSTARECDSSSLSSFSASVSGSITCAAVLAFSVSFSRSSICAAQHEEHLRSTSTSSFQRLERDLGVSSETAPASPSSSAAASACAYRQPRIQHQRHLHLQLQRHPTSAKASCGSSSRSSEARRRQLRQQHFICAVTPAAPLSASATCFSAATLATRVLSSNSSAL